MFISLSFFKKDALLFSEEAIEKYKRSGVTKYSLKAKTKSLLQKKDFLVTL